MELGYFDYYVIGINILGFILFLINKWLLNHTPDKEIHSILTIVSLLGGSLGVLISILIFDHEKLNSNERKEIMMSRVFVICLSIIQIILFLILKGFIRNELTIAFWEYFGTHKILFAYLIIMPPITPYPQSVSPTNWEVSPTFNRGFL